MGTATSDRQLGGDVVLGQKEFKVIRIFSRSYRGATGTKPQQGGHLVFNLWGEHTLDGQQVAICLALLGPPGL